MAKDVLEDMSFAELKAQADKLGIDTGALNKREFLIKAIRGKKFINSGPIHIKYNDVEVDVDPKVFDDFRLIEIMRQMQSNGTYVVDFLKFILGEQQYEDAMCALADEDGKLPMERIKDFMEAVVKQLNAPLKNS
jgi:hypothetical protein